MSKQTANQIRNINSNDDINSLEIEEEDYKKNDNKYIDQLCSAMITPQQVSLMHHSHQNKSMAQLEQFPYDSLIDIYKIPALQKSIQNQDMQRLLNDEEWQMAKRGEYKKESQSKYEQNTIVEMVEQRATRFPLIGVFFLIVAVLSGASSVPFQVHLPLKTPFLKLSWRQLNMLPFLIIMASVQTYYDKKFKFKDVINLSTIKFILIVAFIGDCMSLSNVFSGQYTIMSHALIFSNLGGVVIVVYNLITRKFVHKLEIFGTLIAVIGCSMSVLDNKAKKVDASQQNILLGDVIAVISSFMTAFYYQANQQIASKMPPLLGITVVMFFSQLMLQAFGCFFIPNFDISANPETGSFGFINVDYWPYVVFALGFLTGTCNYGASAMVLKYCSPLVLCSAFLFTPLVGQAYGILLGIDKLPGILTLLGTLVTICGIFFVSAGGRAKAQMTRKL